MDDIKQVFLAKGVTIATAESCTAGLLSGALTAVAGSSGYYVGGVVSYSNEAKMTLLGVSDQTLETLGAVSEDIAMQMADGVRSRLGSDVGISVTGIAGPGGGTTEKPVGLTYIGISDEHGTQAYRYVWEGDRRENRENSVREALRLLAAWAREK